MFNDIEDEKPGNEQTCIESATEVSECAKQFQLGHCYFCGLGQERVWYCASYDEVRHYEVPELSGADLTNLTHRREPTASGDRMRDGKHSKTIAQVSNMKVSQQKLAKSNTL